VRLQFEMKNAEFRSLLERDSTASKDAGTGSSGAFKKPSLGSRARATIPMTPRSVMGRQPKSEFARQVAEHTRNEDGEPSAKRFKSKAAPRGTKLAQGYSDRTAVRDEEPVESDKVKKLRELEEMVKQEKIDRSTFEKLRDQMGIGGDLSTTHLVKGLDFKLLERVRQGDDLNSTEGQGERADIDATEVEDELENVLQRDVVAQKRRSVEPQAQPDGPNEQQTLTRDEILRRLREGRKAGAATVEAPVLGDRFKKLASTQKAGKKKYIENINGRRREILVVTKADGTTKRKTRWLDPEIAKPQAPLGMEVPAELLAKQRALEAQQAADEEDEDIFQGVGADYDPLKDLDSDDEKKSSEHKPEEKNEGLGGSRRSYFGDRTQEDDDTRHKSIAQDPTLLAAFKRAAALRAEATDETAASEARDTDKSKQFLAKLKERERQDALDMDMGFGDSRFGDDDEEEGAIYEDDEEQGTKKRKRGPKKRKGDKDNVADVMSVLDSRNKK
jgi:hypothetical protein